MRIGKEAKGLQAKKAAKANAKLKARPSAAKRRAARRQQAAAEDSTGASAALDEEMEMNA